MRFHFSRSLGRAAALTALSALSGATLAACVLDVSGLPGGADATSTGGAGGAGAVTAGTASVTASSSSSTGGAAPVCGDGKVEAGEACDDGNLALGDGCSPTCTKEMPDACPGVPVPLTTKGVTIKSTLADLHDDLQPSCGKNRLDAVYAVVPSVSGTLTAALHALTNDSLSIRSSCGDAPAVELLCDVGLSDITQPLWVYAGVTYFLVVDGTPDPFTLTLSLSACGDHVTQGLEQCDSASDPLCIGCSKCDGPGEVRDPLSRHCYLLGHGKSWPDARAACIVWGGDLAGISSLEETQFLSNPGKPVVFVDTWTGGQDLAQDCAFSWVNGEPWRPNWAPGEPNNASGSEDCVVLYTSGQINDAKCSDITDYLCERAPGGACGDGIVQPGEECDDAISYVDITCAGCKVSCLAGEFEDPATRHCYRLVGGQGAQLTWGQAHDKCQSLDGAYLAAITSPAESALVQAHLFGPTWIGAQLQGGSFAWTNSDAFCYAGWIAGQPNGSNPCAEILKSGSWDGDQCNNSKDFLCERDN